MPAPLFLDNAVIVPPRISIVPAFWPQPPPMPAPPPFPLAVPAVAESEPSPPMVADAPSGTSSAARPVWRPLFPSEVLRVFDPMSEKSTLAPLATRKAMQSS